MELEIILGILLVYNVLFTGFVVWTFIKMNSEIRQIESKSELAYGETKFNKMRIEALEDIERNRWER